MSSIGTVGIRVIPNLSGFGASVSSAVAGSSGALARSGAAAGLLISAPIVAGAAASISAAVGFETAMAGVAKTVDAPKEAIDALGESVREMARELPYAHTEIAGMAEAVGRFGVDIGDIPAVTEMFVKLGTAIPDMNPEAAAESMVKFFNVMKTPQSEWEPNLSAIVALGNDLPTTEQQIISFASRLSQIANFVPNVSEADVLGLAGAFSALNIKPQAGGSSISRVFLEMDSAIKGSTEAMQPFLDLMNVTEDQFKAMYDQDPAGLFVDFLRAVKTAGDAGAPINDILDSMGLNDIRVRRAILAGAANPELVAESLALANGAMEENNALQDEFEKRAETTAAKWQLFKNKVFDVGITLGDVLLPILIDVMDALEPFIELIGGLAKVWADMDPAFQKTISTILAIIVVAGPMIFIFAKVIPMVQGLTAALWLLSANPVVVLLMAIALAAVLIIYNWGTLKEWFFAFWEWFYTKWDEFYAWFMELWDKVVAVFVAAWDAIWLELQLKWQFIQGVWHGFIFLIQSLGDWIGKLPGWFADAWNWVVETTRNAKNDLVAFMGEIAAAADRALGPIDEVIGAGLGVVGRALQVVGRDNGGIVPGPIGEPRMILAHGGEEVIPRHKDGTAGGGQTININMGGVTMASDMDVVETARALARETERELAAAGVRR